MVYLAVELNSLYLQVVMKELIPTVLAAYVFVRQCKRKNVSFLCNNRAVVAALTSGLSKERRLSILLRELAIFFCT